MHKLHPSDRGAIELVAGVDYNYQDGELDGSTYVFHRVSAFASADAQLQSNDVSPAIGFLHDGETRVTSGALALGFH